MTGTPELMPATLRAADLLSDLLATVRLSGAVLFRAEFHEPWAVGVPEALQLKQAIPFPTEHCIPFHVVATVVAGST